MLTIGRIYKIKGDATGTTMVHTSESNGAYNFVDMAKDKLYTIELSDIHMVEEVAQ